MKNWWLKHFFYGKLGDDRRIGFQFIKRIGDCHYIDIYLWNRMVMINFW